MKLLKVLLLTALTATSASVFAEGGAERSAQYLAQFKLSQEQIHGAQQAPDAQVTAKADAADAQKSGTNSEG